MHNEEQEEEIEVLQSIYDTRFTEISTCPRRIRIDGIVGDGAGLELEVEFTPEYPHSLPPFTILVVSGRISDSEALRVHVKQEAERSLGMAMVFNMVTAIEDWLAKQKRNANALSAKKETAPVQVDDFVLSMKGGAVTRESFMEWNAKFISELQQTRASVVSTNIANGRLTGRQLFHQNRALATSDMNYADANDGAFEGLDDLDIDDLDISDGDGDGEESDKDDD